MQKKFNLDEFDLSSHYVIEASAGTGKTYTIVHMVEKLVRSGISLDNILVVTYTEKAAGELKERLRAMFPDKEEEVERATIGTIHSFCKNIMEQYPVSGDFSSRMDLLSNNDTKPFIRAYLRSGECYETICNIKEKCPMIDIEESLVNKFSELLNQWYLNTRYEEDSSVISLEKNDEIEEDFNILLNLEERYESAIKIARKSTNSSLKKLSGAIDNNSEFVFSGITYRKPSNDASDDEKMAYHVIEYKWKLLQQNSEHLKKIKSTVTNCFVCRFSKDVFQKYQEEKKNKNLQTFNDMIRSVRERILEDPGGSFVQKIKDQYQYGIIDEFQDTNQLQWDIFRNLFLNEDHQLIVVGDPKQSIYAFQGADLEVYERAKQEICSSRKGQDCILSTNYRASGAMIDSINTFFNNEEAITGFSESSCGKEKLKTIYDNTEVENPVWICNPVGSDEKDGFDFKYVNTICEIILDCCSQTDGKTKLQCIDENGNKHNVSFRDFVVLGRTRSELQLAQRAFEKFGIPYVLYKDVTLFSEQECAHWIAMIDAIAQPNFEGRKRSKFRKALYTVFFGYSFAKIRSRKYDSDVIEEISLFEKWRSLVAERKWEELIEAIFIDTNLEQRMSSYNDLKSLAKMKQIGNFCAQYLATYQSLEKLALFLKNLQKERATEEQSEGMDIVARGTDLDCVQLMTIHASKGLEFPVVFSMAGRKNYPNNSPSYVYHMDGQRWLSFSKMDTYKEERKKETKRLMYVAYTRAKYLLVLPNENRLSEIGNPIQTFFKTGKGKEILLTSKSDEKLQEEAKSLLTSTRNEVLDERETQKEKLKNMVKQKGEHLSFKHTYSSLSHARLSEEMITETGVSRDKEELSHEKEVRGLSEYDSNGKGIPCQWDKNQEPFTLSEDYPAGAGLGNALHEIFELIDYQNISNEAQLTNLIHDCFARQGFLASDSWNNDTKQMVRHVLKAKYPVIQGGELIEGEDFSLSEIPVRDRKNEAEFNFNKEGTYLKHYYNGFIDLIFRRGEFYSILDWKSDRLNETFLSYSETESLKNHVDELYSIQRVLYAYCLIKWLKNFYPDCSEQEIFEQHFGGVYYVFLRGCKESTGNGIYAHTWEDFASLEAMYQEILKKK